MGTRSLIAKKQDDGRWKYIYCHWDGYPEWNGMILKNHYTDPKKVDKLLNLGDISSLQKIVGHKHKFDNVGKDIVSTTAYHRDRGEPWEQVKPQFAKTKKELIEIGEQGWTEYVYFYENGKWTWKSV